MKNKTQHYGVIVPMITPVTATGRLDEAAVDRLVDFLVAGGVDGIFVMGTTGESVSVPHSFRRNLVERTVARVGGRAKVYAGLGDLYPKDVASGNDYFAAGAQAVVARPPVSFPVEKLLPWFQSLRIHPRAERFSSCRSARRIGVCKSRPCPRDRGTSNSFVGG